jgi:YVTN family beta-propeller protein
VALDLSPDGRTAYVSNGDSAELTVVDVVSGKVTKTIPVGVAPEGVAVRPDGKIVYVATCGSDEIYAIDTAKLTLVMRINGGPCPRSVLFSRDGATAFAIDEQMSTVNILDARKHKMKEQVSLTDQVRTRRVLQPGGGVLSPDGKLLYVTGGAGRSVVALDVAGKKLARAFDDVGSRPRGIAISRDGKTIYTANGPSNDVAVIDTASGTVGKRVRVDGGPWGLVLAASP